jgi:hypothetical protein
MLDSFAVTVDDPGPITEQGVGSNQFCTSAVTSQLGAVALVDH